MRRPTDTSRTRAGGRAHLGYAAFRALYRGRYLRYAYACLGREQQVFALVQDVFDELAVRWTEALRSPSPAALAWELLTTKLRAACGDGAAAELRARLPDEAADAVVLCQWCGMAVEEAADVMGVDASSVTSRLGTAHRVLALSWAGGPGPPLPSMVASRSADRGAQGAG